MQTRAESPAGRFGDVSYYDLTNDPIAEVRRICGLAGIGFDDDAEREAVQYMAANPQNRFGKHAYKLGAFGLSEQVVDDAFSSLPGDICNPVRRGPEPAIKLQ